MPKLFYAISLLVLSSCMSPRLDPVLSPKLNYEHDLEMEVAVYQNGQWTLPKRVKGMTVVPQSERYKIKVWPPSNADLISLTSCHRQWKSPNPERKKDGWFKKGYYEFEVMPTLDLEAAKACPFETGVYDKQGQHSWGTIVIDSPRETMSAKVECNGYTELFGGTSVCQSKKGLLQSIHFPRPVEATKTPGCVLPTAKNGKDWIFQMPKGKCVVFFVDSKDADKVHKAVLYGYDLIPLRRD